ncbi:MAG: hypothetical protein AAFN00_01700 [Cyanobacteria bacterium J06558_2]
MFITPGNFNLTSTITDDWGTVQRIAINLEALSATEDWKIEVPLDKYEIDQIYGAELIDENGKTYIVGASWNRSLEAGQTSEIILIVDEIPHTEGDLNLTSTITDDWGTVQRIAIELEAVTTATDWKIEVPQESYTVDQVYGAELIEENGKLYLTGASWNRSLEAGQTSEIILIVDEIPNTLPSADVPSSTPSTPSTPATPPSAPPAEPISVEPTVNVDSEIVEDWRGGYKLEIDLTSDSAISDWQADFSFPYSIRAAYGVDIADNGDGNFSMTGENGWRNIQPGQTVTAILIVDDFGQSAIAPELEFSAATTENMQPPAPEPAPEPEVSEPAPEPAPEPEVNEPAPEPAPEPDNSGNDLGANPEGSGRTINVEQEFGGDLEGAIAAANDGDVVQLGGKTYYTYGIEVNKDITIDGQEGTVIDGQGTGGTVLSLYEGASGATIQDLHITNGNKGIHGHAASDLTLQNLEVTNIGLNQTLRDNQDNTAIQLNLADGAQILNSVIRDVGRKGVGINSTDGAFVSGLTVQNVNLAAEHAQSHDAAGFKLFNTNDIELADSYFSDINAYFIWNDTTNNTTIDNNVAENIGEDFLRPVFNTNVYIGGIYNEKSANAIIKNNTTTSVGNFPGLNATEFSTETMVLENNNFSIEQVNTTDYWVNQEIETLIAVTENPLEADFNLFADEYFAQANIG